MSDVINQKPLTPEEYGEKIIAAKQRQKELSKEIEDWKSGKLKTPYYNAQVEDAKLAMRKSFYRDNKITKSISEERLAAILKRVSYI